MTFIFKCSKCGNRIFFQEYTLIDDQKICLPCESNLRKQEEIRKEQEKIRQNELDIRKKREQEKDREADELLRKQLEQERQKLLEKARKAALRKEKKLSKKKEKIIDSRNVIYISLEQKAKKLSRVHNKVLYVYADVKNIKAIEWVDGKKRIALNKERELRRTHKGGFSQEKFQHFIDMKKKQTAQWVEDNLLQEGVLRPPYDKFIVETNDPLLQKRINEIIDRL